MRCLPILLFVWLSGCVSTPQTKQVGPELAGAVPKHWAYAAGDAYFNFEGEAKEPQKGPEPGECFCGRMPRPDGSLGCDLWDPVDTRSRWQVADSANCRSADCAKVTEASGFCKRIYDFPVEAWAAPGPCWCDWVAVEDPGTDYACGLWRDSDAYIIEYHRSTECNPETCKSAPFRLTQAFCTDQIESFYK